MALDEELLEILVCPDCKRELVYAQEEEFLLCDSCDLKFKIEDEIPVMLLDEAEEIGADEKERILEKHK